MSLRPMSTLALGLLLVLAACSDGGGGEISSDATTTEEGTSSSTPGPTYQRYEDYPGEELLYNDGSMSVDLRVKTVETAWLTELADRPAQVGSHYLAIYVVVTGEKADRGVDAAVLNAFSLGLRFGTGEDCERDRIGYRDESMEKFCHDNATLATYLWDVPHRDWGSYEWDEGGSAGIPLDAGQMMAGVVAFTVPDTFEATGVIEFCGKNEDAILMDYDTCVAVPAPTGARN